MKGQIGARDAGFVASPPAIDPSEPGVSSARPNRHTAVTRWRMRRDHLDQTPELWLRWDGNPFDGLSTSELLSRLSTWIEEREAALGARQPARRLAADTVAALITLTKDIADRKVRREAIYKAVLAMQHRKDEADKLIEFAKDLVRQTRKARGRVVRKAFNDEFNAIWRDLFVRLAPEEPPIPAFAIREGVRTDIEAVLETHHRQEGQGGNPQTMLSAGNLSTAALTLSWPSTCLWSPDCPA